MTITEKDIIRKGSRTFVKPEVLAEMNAQDGYTPSIKIKVWFITKNFSQSEKYIMQSGDSEIQKETEKAMLIKWTSDNGSFTKWVPKSCIN